MNYILVAYEDTSGVLKSYFIEARNNLNDFLLSKSKNILNDIKNDCNSKTFIRNCIVQSNQELNLIFYSHGDEISIVDNNNEEFLTYEMDLSSIKINIFYSTACETAKGKLKSKIIKHSKFFFGYNSIAYVVVGNNNVKDIFIECDNFCIKEIASGIEDKNLLEIKTDKFFKKQINQFIEEDLIFEAILLMHNKESIEIH